MTEMGCSHGVSVVVPDTREQLHLFYVDNMTIEPKQVIVVRKDLNMRKGKMISQGCHASVGAVLKCMNKVNKGDDSNFDALEEWLAGRFTKICVYVESEKELLDIYANAKDAALNVKLIKDAGLTEFNGVPTLTCLAIGPDYPDKIDKITGHLKLL
jgi:PTH2 family peptidyl-tRNA hydrolase